MDKFDAELLADEWDAVIEEMASLRAQLAAEKSESDSYHRFWIETRAQLASARKALQFVETNASQQYIRAVASDALSDIWGSK